MAIAYYNGEFLPVGQKTIEIQDRGHQFGDGVYEVIRVYGGTPFKLREHLVRLERSMAEIQIQPGCTMEKLEQIILTAIEKAQIAEAEVYLQFTRGASPRQHAFPPEGKPNLSIIVSAAQAVPEEKRNSGVPVILQEDQRWANCFIKSLNLLPNVLAKQAAVSSGAFEAILVRNGVVTEGSSSNVFAVKNGELYTHQEDKGILSGITRAVVIELARKEGYAVHETPFTPQFLMEADEVFITGTGYEVLPVCSVDFAPIGEGKPGRMASHLQFLFRQECR